jgi:large subunit ribosomal protein L9
VAEALTKMGFAISKTQIRMPLGALKAVGEFPVNVAPHTDVLVEVSVQVVRDTE